MKAKINQRVIKCVHQLMKIAKDKTLERLIKIGEEEDIMDTHH